MTDGQKELIFSSFRKRVCERSRKVDPTESYDWHDLSLGFFLSFDITIEEAHELAMEVRYTHHYWMD